MTLMEDGTLHWGRIPPLAKVGSRKQLRFTGPLNPFNGVTVRLVAFPLLTPGATLTLPALVMANEGDAVTVTGTESVAEIVVFDADVAFTARLYFPGVVVEVVFTAASASVGKTPFVATEYGTEQVGKLAGL